jgi:hypothetical protein
MVYFYTRFLDFLMGQDSVNIYIPTVKKIIMLPLLDLHSFVKFFSTKHRSTNAKEETDRSPQSPHHEQRHLCLASPLRQTPPSNTVIYMEGVLAGCLDGALAASLDSALAASLDATLAAILDGLPRHLPVRRTANQSSTGSAPPASLQQHLYSTRFYYFLTTA